MTSSGPLVDEQHDQVDLGVVLRDRLRDVLQQHRLAGARRRDDQAALALADRRHQVHDPRRQVVRRRLEHEALLRVERRQVLEEQLVARLVGRLEVDRLDLDQREVALAFLRRPDLARDGVAGLQVELADLRRRDVDVVGAGQVVVVGRAQEAEAVGQHLEHAFREDEAALLGLRLEDLEDQLLLAHAGRAGDVQVLGDLRELLDAHVLQLGDVQALAAAAAVLPGCAALAWRRRRCGWRRLAAGAAAGAAGLPAGLERAAGALRGGAGAVGRRLPWRPARACSTRVARWRLLALVAGCRARRRWRPDCACWLWHGTTGVLGQMLDVSVPCDDS